MQKSGKRGWRSPLGARGGVPALSSGKAWRMAAGSIATRFAGHESRPQNSAKCKFHLTLSGGNGLLFRSAFPQATHWSGAASMPRGERSSVQFLHRNARQTRCGCARPGPRNELQRAGTVSHGL